MVHLPTFTVGKFTPYMYPMGLISFYCPNYNDITGHHFKLVANSIQKILRSYAQIQVGKLPFLKPT